MNSNKSKNLPEVAAVFFKLGVIAFGGPAAHVAMMQDEIVDKRKWMTTEHFLDLMGATNLIPGPNSTEMTMHCGYERAGWMGLFTAGACFIFPAVVITGIFAYLYVTYGSLPQVEPFIYGIKPAVLAVIAGAVLKLGKKALKTNELIFLGILVLGAALYGLNEVVLLLAAGLIGALFFYSRYRYTNPSVFIFPLFFWQATSAAVAKLTTAKVFLSFLKVGAILYGSGYVLFAYLDAELVAKGLLSRPELVDAIAVGQLTPGPVLSTATFIGYQLNGISGAVAATVGIFLPSFLFVWMLNPLVAKMRASKFLSYFLDCVNVAAVAVMAAVLIEMGRDVLLDWRAVAIAVISFGLVFGVKKFSSLWIVVIGAILGYVFSLF